MRFRALFALLAFFGIMNFSTAFADDDKVNYILPYPTANEIHDAWTPDGQTFYFACDAGEIYKLEGEEFTRMETPTQYPLYCIHGVSETDIWAAGGDDYSQSASDRTVYLHYDGTSWSEIPAPVFLETTYPPDDIFAVAANDVWAVDSSSTSLFHWDGSAWSFVDPDIEIAGGFEAVYGFAANDVYAVGDYGKIIHYDGTDWAVQSHADAVSSTISSNFFKDVWGPDADNVFACANYGRVHYFNKITSEWDQLAKDLGGFFSGGTTLTSIAGASKDEIFFSSHNGHLYSYDGVNFTEIQPTETWGQNVIRRTADGKYGVAGANGRIEQYDGQWSPIYRMPEDKSYWSHIAWADGNLWLTPNWIGYGAGVCSWDKGRLTKHFADQESQDHVACLKAFADNEVWLGTYLDSAVHDGTHRYNGSQWEKILPQTFVDIIKTSSGEYFIITHNGSSIGIPHRLNNNALVDPLIEDPANNYCSLAEGSDGKVYAVGDGGKIVSFSNGVWTSENSGTGKDLAAVAAANGYVYAVGEDKTAIYKTDGGAWTPVSGISSRQDNNFCGIVHMEDGNFVAILNTPDTFIGADKGEIYLLSDGQAQLFQGWITPDLKGITSSDDGRIFICGEIGTILSSRALKKGDVNVDIALNLDDAIIALQTQTKGDVDLKRADWAVEATDIGANGKVGMEDALFILQDLAGLIYP